MKINCLFLILTSLFLFSFYSCESDANGDAFQEEHPSGIVSFTSFVNNRTSTKVIGANWESGDKIGIYMKSAGKVLTDKTILNEAMNKIYTTNGDGIFNSESSSQTIYYPKGDVSVDFIAYYPHIKDISGYKYKVNVVDQTSPQNIDLLYSNNIIDVDQMNPGKQLEFNRQLASLRLNISHASGIANIDGVSVELSGARTKADFNLADGTLVVDEGSVAVIKLKVTVENSMAIAEAILLPDEGSEERVIIINVPSLGVNFKWEIPAEVKFEKGGRYTRNISLETE